MRLTVEQRAKAAKAHFVDGESWPVVAERFEGMSADRLRGQVRSAVLAGNITQGGQILVEDAYRPAAADERPAQRVPDGVAAVDTDVVPLSGKKARPELGIAYGDTQFGEHQFMLPCWNWFVEEIVRRARAVQPERVRLYHVGDAVTGGGVFRQQEIHVALPSTDPQVLYGAAKELELVERVEETGAEVELVRVKGNHDKNRQGADLTFELSRLLFMLGIRVRYCGDRAAVNLAPEGVEPYLLGLEHSSGNSAYYARSYASIRNLQRYTLQSSSMGRHRSEEGDRIPIRRWCTGHSHWLQIGMDIGGVQVDTVGGWTRPERYTLGGEVRPIGGIAYVHTGNRLAIESVKPPDELVMQSADDLRLHTRNLADIAARLEAMTERFLQLGLIVPQGAVV